MGQSSRSVKYVENRRTNCYGGFGGISIDDDDSAPVGLSAEECQERCEDDANCGCASYELDSGKCWKRADCVQTEFDNMDGYSVFIKISKPSPPPAKYLFWSGRNCYENHGGSDIDTDET